MAFERHVARRHMADADDGQIPNLSIANKTVDIFVIPGIPVKQVDCDEAVTRLDFVYQLPFRSYVGANGLLGQHMLAGGKSLADLVGTCVGECE